MPHLTILGYNLADQGIQHAVFGYRDRNISGVLENIVYNELVMRGYQVNIGKMQDLEIDFIAEKFGDKIYVQVAYQMNTEKLFQENSRHCLWYATNILNMSCRWTNISKIT